MNARILFIKHSELKSYVYQFIVIEFFKNFGSDSKSEAVLILNFKTYYKYKQDRLHIIANFEKS